MCKQSQRIIDDSFNLECCPDSDATATVINGGSSPDPRFGKVYWFEGIAVCDECGFTDWVSDTSH